MSVIIIQCLFSACKGIDFFEQKPYHEERILCKNENNLKYYADFNCIFITFAPVFKRIYYYY